jgi:hypothetical protein
MARFYGNVYYGETVEREDYPGSWTTELASRSYFGDITKVSRRLESSDKVNDDIVISNVISIVADAYAMEHFSAIRCVEYMGIKWRVSTVEVNPPRLTLTLGGVYND